MVKVVLMREKQTLEVDYEGTIIDLLPLVGYSLETAVVLKNGSPVEEEETVGEADEVRVIPVVSGG
ncbi:thiamine biosynthesis protein ThiS [archaeon]|jgi:sulfur carrier protein ThiS|nr:MAG: thiamine biosynthesis protein ThiS [archaeon]